MLWMFVGDVIKRILFGFFGPLYRALGPDSMDQIFNLRFFGIYAIIQVFGVLD